MQSLLGIPPAHKRPFTLISTFYLLLALSYGVIIPIFEAPDENIHYFTAQWIADYQRLPFVPQTAAEAERLDLQREWTGQEAAQPPLYYLLASLVIAPFDTAQARDLVEHNDFVRLGDASSPHNKNRFVHGAGEQWPWRGYVLAVHLLRVISAVIGWGTIVFIYKAALALWPTHPDRALWGMGFVAFLPQFVAQHAAVSNDVLITFLVTAVLALLLKTEDVHEKPSWQNDLWLGIGVGLAALTKSQGLVLAVFVLGTVLIRGIGRLHLWEIGQRWFRIGSVILFLAGWLWWRNWVLYGDMTAANQFVLIAGGDRGYTLGQVLAEWPGIWLSSIAVFGWFNIIPPLWVHLLWTAGVVMAIVCAVWAYVRQASIKWNRSALWHWFQSWPILLFGWVLAVCLGLIVFMMRTPAAQGRLLFPALLPIALWVGFGLDSARHFVGSSLKSGIDRIKNSAFGSLLPALLAVHVYLLGWVIAPVYARPQTITLEDVPATAVASTEMGLGLRLVGAEVIAGQQGVVLGDAIEVLLYWEKVSESADMGRPELVVELFGRDLTLLGKQQTYHGGGIYPADLWPIAQTGQANIVVEHLFIPTFQSDESSLRKGLPVEARVLVKLAGQDAVADIGGVKIAPTAWPKPINNVVAQLGEHIELVEVNVSATEVTAGESVTVDVVWQATADVDKDYVTLVHLGQPHQPPVAQGDGWPVSGWYRTGLWRAGEQVRDRYVVTVPTEAAVGDYRLLLGMYDAADPAFTRLPVTVEGVAQAENGLVIEVVTVQD